MENYGKLAALVEARIEGFLPPLDERAGALREAVRYTLLLPGKRLRPVLTLLACGAAGGELEDALPYACAIEFIHNYSLIHDDLPAMDDDDLRRGAPTNHKVFGEATAILAGDGLLSAAFEVLHGDYLAHLDEPEPLRRRLLAGAAVAEGCGLCGMVAGQAADIAAGGRGASAELLEYIHMNKTAALIRSAILAGAHIGGVDGEALAAFSSFGEKLGLAFQIADDILDETGRASVIGKTAGKDAAAGKATYPALYGLDASRARLLSLTERAAEALRRASLKNEETRTLICLARELAERRK